LGLRFKAFGRSDVGQVRQRNEDTLAVEPSNGIVVVADGMGGAPAGHVASSLAVQAVARGLHAGEGMEKAIQGANEKILSKVEEDPALAGMGSTVTALKASGERRTYELGHVGDSRAYLLSGDRFSQLSRDHTMVRDMVEAGKLPASAEREHPLGHILTRVLGTEDSVEVDVQEGEIADGDVFLLCSDGLVKVMDDREVEEWVRGVDANSLEDVVGAMLEVANERGAPDNVTVALLFATNSSA
jgi:protein phosphatase